MRRVACGRFAHTGRYAPAYRAARSDISKLMKQRKRKRKKIPLWVAPNSGFAASACGRFAPWVTTLPLGTLRTMTYPRAPQKNL